MTVSFFKATTPDGRTVVEVKVPGDSVSEVGLEFSCSVVLDGRLPALEELATTDKHEMVLWVKKQMKEAMRRSR
jgi:hypothetical protein